MNFQELYLFDIYSLDPIFGIYFADILQEDASLESHVICLQEVDTQGYESERCYMVGALATYLRLQQQSGRPLRSPKNHIHYSDAQIQYIQSKINTLASTLPSTQPPSSIGRLEYQYIQELVKDGPLDLLSTVQQSNMDEVDELYELLEIVRRYSVMTDEEVRSSFSEIHANLQFHNGAMRELMQIDNWYSDIQDEFRSICRQSNRMILYHLCKILEEQDAYFDDDADVYSVMNIT